MYRLCFNDMENLPHTFPNKYGMTFSNLQIIKSDICFRFQKSLFVFTFVCNVTDFYEFNSPTFRRRPSKRFRKKKKPLVKLTCQHFRVFNFCI